MSISLQGCVEWRRTAPYHVQLELERETEPLHPPREVQIQGRVVRIFRSDGRLGSGDRVAFSLWVCQPGDEPTGPAYIYFEHFIRANYMEVYLSGNPPACTLAGYELAVIDTPSEQPTMTVQQLEELAGLVSTKAQSLLKKKPWWRRVLGKVVDRDT
jgi:hypothetical protein